MTYLTQEQIVDTEFARFTTENISELSSLESSQLHHGYGTGIRNRYKLWEPGNPLTTQWFKDSDAAPDGNHAFIIDGCDHHPQHPDQVSGEII